MAKIKWVEAEDGEQAAFEFTDNLCRCKDEGKIEWVLVVEEGHAMLKHDDPDCRGDFSEYPEDIWLDDIPVTVEAVVHSDYYSGDIDVEYIIELKEP